MIYKASLPSPHDLNQMDPVTPKIRAFISSFRSTAASILSGRDPRIALILGPCSIHNLLEAITYGMRLKELQVQVSNTFFLIMRVFFEKPRSHLGWKGFIYDPFLDGSCNFSEGLKEARRLLLQLTNLGIPCATEFLEPLITPYLSSLITWGLIGARTSASQPHRELASGLPFPVGFKNGIYGELELAIHGILSARSPHAHFWIDPQARLASVQTQGNLLTHLVLRGSQLQPNCDAKSVQNALTLLQTHHLEQQLLIDCAHGNCGKNLAKQREAFEQCIEQIRAGRTAIRGLMLESHLLPGNQPLNSQSNRLLYGVSITDPCLGWEETEELVLNSHELFKRVSKGSPISMRRVQN